eukprot:scaffold536_cov250-Pinguiococcus_pyrenoidosus.AAC.20
MGLKQANRQKSDLGALLRQSAHRPLVLQPCLERVDGVQDRLVHQLGQDAGGEDLERPNDAMVRHGVRLESGVNFGGKNGGLSGSIVDVQERS